MCQNSHSLFSNFPFCVIFLFFLEYLFIYIYIYIYVFPKQLYAVGVLAVYLLLADVCPGCFRRCGDQLLCAGCGLGDGCVAPVYAKWSVISLSTEKHNGFGMFFPDASRCPQMPPDASRYLPDASQMPPRCFSPQCFFSMILLPMIPPQRSLLYDCSSNDSSSMILRHWFFLP